MIGQKWLHKSDNESCILFFNGWGMDESAVSEVQVINHDICMFYMYHELQPDFQPFNNYKNIYLISWSMGVWAAEYFLTSSALSISKYIAINGTPAPIHDTTGIPEKTFKGTLDNWNEVNRTKFNRRMLYGRGERLNSPVLSNRHLTDQVNELKFIYDRAHAPAHNHLDWDMTFIGLNDLIFTAENQQNFWRTRTHMQLGEFPHYPFFNYRNWNQLIEL